MKVLRYYRRRDIRVEEDERKGVGKDEVRVKILWCGICTTDLIEFVRGPILYPKNRPIIPGHEFGGEIVEVGENINDLEVGDLVFVSPLIYCGKCKYCINGRENLCLNGGYLGITHDGGFREEIVLNRKNVYKAPKDINPELLVFAEPMAAIIHASLMGVGEKFLVIGFGTVGYIMAQFLRNMGGDVTVLEVIEERREMAKEMGFRILESESEKFDTVFEVAGASIEAVQSSDPIKASIKYVDPGGKVVIFGIHYIPITLNILDALTRELSISTSYLYTPPDFEKAVSIISNGEIDLSRIITKKILLDDIEEEGFIELETNKKEHFKIIVTPYKEIIENGG